MKQRFTKRTRLVSALLTLAMVFTFLPISAFAEVQTYIPLYKFQDETFRKYLEQFDTDHDTFLSTDEREAVTKIDLQGGYKGKKIKDLTGIEFFPNLETLWCPVNQLSSLDVSENEKLADLWCSQNNLTSLDVSKNPELKELWCYDNQLSSLDVRQNTALKTLSCFKNQLTELDVTQFIALEELKCYQNQLTSLDVRQNAALTYLDCGKNQLTSLDVHQNTALKNLECYENNLTSLDVRQNTALEHLNCYQNQLTSLDVRQNAALTYLDCGKNQLTSLDVRENAALNYLYCSPNNLTSLDVSQTAVTILGVSGNQIDINVETTPRTFDLSNLPGFEASKVSKWVGGTVSGNTLTVDKNATQVTYTYDCGKGLSRDFTLNVKVVPDGSGGGTTIPPEAGKYQLTVTDGVATVNGITRAVLNVKPGDTVTLTADTTKFPENEEFGWWEITPYGSVSNTLTGQYQRTATFTMPSENVSARAMSKSAGVSTGGDDGGGGGGAAILLVGGAAVAGLVGYGVYSYVSEQQLKALLPEGVAMPENRAQTALLLWNTAGRPEPAEAPAFKDVADPDTAKAAQWCVEHGLMDQKLGGRFAPDNSDPAYKTLNAYQQLVG